MPALSIADLNNAKQDVDHIAAVANSSSPTATDRLGNSKRTLSGIEADAVQRMDVIDAAAEGQRQGIQAAAEVVLAGAGYAPPVAYAAGLTMSVRTQTVEHGGFVYAPKLSDLPFTTSGTFETGKFRLIQGVTGVDLAAASGSAMVGFTNGVAGAIVRSVQDKLRDFVDPRDFGAHPITEVGYETYDSTVAFDNAIKYAIANNISEVRFEGKYLIDTALYTFELPRDDGTVYPGWVGAGDANIPAEGAVTMPACLRIDGSVALRGKNMQKDELIGSWNASSSPIDTSQKIGILITAGSKYSGTIRYELTDFAIRNFMIGRVVEGIANVAYEQIKVSGCGITGVFQGADSFKQGRMLHDSNLAGDVFGGWWTQRNSTRQDAAYLPPYPASDVHAVGWTDFVHTDSLFYATELTWGTRHQAIDTFFDTYFFKSANSARTSAGGRLSNNDAPNPALIPTYTGIAGRDRTYISRYGRGAVLLKIANLKSLGTQRTPVCFMRHPSVPTGGNVLENAYVEKSGVINPSAVPGTTNRFGIDNADPYRAAGYGIGHSVASGFNVKNVLLTGVQQAPVSDGGQAISEGPQRILRTNYSGTSEQASNLFFEYVETGSSFSKKYIGHKDYLVVPEIRFGSETAEGFQNVETGSHTATLTCGTSGSVTLSESRMDYERTHKDVHAHAVLTVGSVSAPVGRIEISLPFIADDTKGRALVDVKVVNAVTAKPYEFIAHVQPTSSTLRLYLGDATTFQSDSAQELKAGTQIYIDVTYYPKF